QYAEHLKDKLEEELTRAQIASSVIEKLRQEARKEVISDHSKCNRRVDDLQLQLKYKDVELQNELTRVDLFAKTIKDLREALPKRGMRQALEACPADLSIVSCSFNGGSSVVKYVQRKCHSTTTSVTGMSPSSKRNKLSFARVYSDHVVIII
ncbi:hypothetical protein AAVH_39104, partial [Aphelenchoides avenae]